MLDLQLYERDTEICDPEPAALPVRSRTSTDGALTMQVYKEGNWHRRTPDLASTACGKPIHSTFDPVRREELCLPLCHECFTKFEQERAAITLSQQNNL